ncbi:hypothetical protein G5714_010351 [Onychostoma macrolepis]|uniref:C3H1-type domain-containing protein n=1 Tax=Onychostoma macrolepis TaxID=369639 RepID=A0A7J6CPM1_9TELE|nr:hypothetical protein G5714_010351 [Onychostoma macrolepis]
MSGQPTSDWEFERGSCCRGETDCRFAHPTGSAENTVTVCMDHAVPHALAKRVALEWQPVSPTHLQMATALLPTVPMMLGAPAVPAVSPYVAAATANASQDRCSGAEELSLIPMVPPTAMLRQAL